jgi:hypothetical protein
MVPKCPTPSPPLYSLLLSLGQRAVAVQDNAYQTHLLSLPTLISCSVFLLKILRGKESIWREILNLTSINTKEIRRHSPSQSPSFSTALDLRLIPRLVRLTRCQIPRYLSAPLNHYRRSFIRQPLTQHEQERFL